MPTSTDKQYRSMIYVPFSVRMQIANNKCIYVLFQNTYNRYNFITQYHRYGDIISIILDDIAASRF